MGHTEHRAPCENHGMILVLGLTLPYLVCDLLEPDDRHIECLMCGKKHTKKLASYSRTFCI